LKSYHRCLAAIVTENKLIQVNLELLATHRLVGADQPLLQVPNGRISQRHHQFRAFAEIALQGLGARNMPEAHLFKTGKAFEAVRVEVEPEATFCWANALRVTDLKSGITAIRTRSDNFQDHRHRILLEQTNSKLTNAPRE